MEKIYIEDSEIKVVEKNITEDEKHVVNDNSYSIRSVVKTEFQSSIFSYSETERVLVSKIIRYNEEYFKIVLFNDMLSKAWVIIELSSKLNIKVKRVAENMFIVVGESQNSQIMSQISFCKLKPSTKVEEIAISFNKLLNIHYFAKQKQVALEYEEVNVDMTRRVLALYDYGGKLQKTLFEYYIGQGEEYTYTIEGNKIEILKNWQYYFTKLKKFYNIKSGRNILWLKC